MMSDGDAGLPKYTAGAAMWRFACTAGKTEASLCGQYRGEEETWQEQGTLPMHVHVVHGRKAAHLERVVHIGEMVEIHDAVLCCLTAAGGWSPTAPAFGITPSSMLGLTAVAATCMCRARTAWLLFFCRPGCKSSSRCCCGEDGLPLSVRGPQMRSAMKPSSAYRWWISV